MTIIKIKKDIKEITGCFGCPFSRCDYVLDEYGEDTGHCKSWCALTHDDCGDDENRGEPLWEEKLESCPIVSIEIINELESKET